MSTYGTIPTSEESGPINVSKVNLLTQPGQEDSDIEAAESRELLAEHLKENENENADLASLLSDPENPKALKTLKTLAKLSWPTIVTFLLELLPGLVNTIAVGRLGEDELASASLAGMYCNVTGFTVGFGLATAMDTLCSQSYGANNRKGLGIVLQRALLILLVFCIPISVLWIFAEPILLGMGQSERVAELSGLYCRVMLAGLYPIFVYEALKKFLQAQAVVLPQMWIAVIANIWSLLANWVLVDVLEMGYIGAPIARASTNVLLPVLTILYMACFGNYKETWDGWSKEAFRKWGQFLILGVPGMLMLCIEWWSFEFLAIFAGILGTTELAAQSIVYNVVLMTFFIPYGISVASSIIIGNALGRGCEKVARKTTIMSYWFTVFLEVISAILLVCLRDYIPMAFTNDPEVIALAASIIPIAAGYQIFDGLAAISGGVLRGCGKQKIGAVSNFVGYLVLGLGSSAALGFLTPLGIYGLWIGVAIALFSISVISGFIVWRTNWELEVERAKERVSINFSH